MASVQMSQILRDQIADNFRQQMFKAYRVQSNIEEHVKNVVNHIEMLDDDFRCAVDLQKEWNDLYKTLAVKFPNATSSNYYRDLIMPEFIKSQKTLGLIINPELPAESNYTFYENYSNYDKDVEEQSYGKKEYKRGLANYNKNDVAVIINDISPFYAPYEFTLEYHRGWHNTNRVYSPHGSCMLITDPKMCEAFGKIGEVEIKVADKLKVFVEYLEKITTLKKFIDEWPGGLDLVPQEYKDRMVKKTVKSTVQRLTPEQIIPDELKQEMNKVVLSNKLLGDD
jgi:hypothetical protein